MVVERFDKHSAGNVECLLKAKDGEPMWIILGRDPVYKEVVEFWAQARERAIADGRIEDTPHEREHIATARRYVGASYERS
jgi:hypothetical protein